MVSKDSPQGHGHAGLKPILEACSEYLKGFVLLTTCEEKAQGFEASLWRMCAGKRMTDFFADKGAPCLTHDLVNQCAGHIMQTNTGVLITIEPHIPMTDGVWEAAATQFPRACMVERHVEEREQLDEAEAALVKRTTAVQGSVASGRG